MDWHNETEQQEENASKASHEEKEEASVPPTKVSPIENGKTTTGLEENVAGLLCYLAGFITGIVFLLIEKENRFVRYHAIQSIIVSVVLIILNVILTAIPLFGWVLGLILSPLYVILWVFMMWKAYQGKWFKLPISGDMAEKQLDKVK